MDYRRVRPSDERRRRVMLDDSRLANGAADAEESSSDESAGKSTRKNAKSYPDDALASRQMRLTDLLPVRAWVVLAICAATVLAATGVHFAHLQREGLSSFFGAASYIFDVDVPGSLGRGLSVLLLSGATLASFLIYSLRRHKMDDYRGHYGIWLWVALALLGLTAGEYFGATGLVESLVERYAPIALVSRMPLVVHSLVAFGALLFLARLGTEMHRCRLALAVLVPLLFAVGAVVALEAGWRPSGTEIPEELLAYHARLASRGLLFAMLLVYGRYTRLDALGNIKARERKPRKKATPLVEKVKVDVEKPAATEKPAAPMKTVTPTPAPTVVPAPVATKPSASAKPATISASKPVLTFGQKPSEEEDDDAGQNRLSRAERRRLKQLGKAA